MGVDILSLLRRDGLTLTAEDDRLIVEPAGSITEQHRALIRTHKAELLDLLRSGATPADGCGTCQHIRRPGLADGYCLSRSDLLPAYGTGHPLRLRPEDNGVTCGSWEGRR